MQQIFVLKYNEQWKGYLLEKVVNGGIIHLEPFLTGDVGCHAIDFFKEWLNTPGERDAGGNYSHLEKVEDKVVLSFEYDWFHETPGAPVLEMTIDELNYILDRWREACQKKPKRIIFTRDDGKITVDFED